MRIRVSCENGHEEFFTITSDGDAGDKGMSPATKEAYWGDFCRLVEMSSNESMLQKPGCLACGGKVKCEVVDG
jgi:hypothetical protein